MKIKVLIVLFGITSFCVTSRFPQLVNPDNYPAVGSKELGQLFSKLQLTNQGIADFTNFNKVDDQGISASRYTIAFSTYFLALEQYHKFPVRREVIQPAIDLINIRIL